MRTFRLSAIEQLVGFLVGHEVSDYTCADRRVRGHVHDYEPLAATDAKTIALPAQAFPADEIRTALARL